MQYIMGGLRGWQFPKPTLHPVGKTNASDENCFVFCYTPQIVGIYQRPINEPVLLTSPLNCFACITFKFAFLAPSGVQIYITYAKQGSIRIPKVIKWMLYNHHAQFFWSTEIIKWIINISRLKTEVNFFLAEIWLRDASFIKY